MFGPAVWSNRQVGPRRSHDPRILARELVASSGYAALKVSLSNEYAVSKFAVVIFADVMDAREGIRTLKDLAAEEAIQLHGAAMITKANSGEFTMQVAADDGLAVAMTGALLGGLTGLVIGPLAAAILAAGGAVYGAAVALTNRHARMAVTERVGQDLTPDSAAVVANVTDEDSAALVARLEAIGGTVTRLEDSNRFITHGG